MADTMSPVALATPYDEKKFTELLLHIARLLMDDPQGGATKLNKALWWSECASMRSTGRSITGADFQKLAKGPAPRRLKPVRDRLIEAGQARLEHASHMGMRLDRLVPLREADLNVFTAEELGLVEQVVTEIRGRSAGQVSNDSHQEMGWRMVAEKETIPLTSAFLADETIVTAAMRAKAKELSEAQRNQPVT